MSGRCTHPTEHRWQARQMWMCCRCCSWFWGDKRGPVPATDIYGRAAKGDT